MIRRVPPEWDKGALFGESDESTSVEEPDCAITKTFYLWEHRHVFCALKNALEKGKRADKTAKRHNRNSE